MSIAENIQNIYKTINSNQFLPNKVGDIILLGVTKTVDYRRINEAIASGLKVIGENKVQELLDKYDLVSKDVQWHFIGHLQTNKVKYIIDKVTLIHSVDSVKLAKTIDQHASKIGKVMDILVQVNISKESSKYGVDPGDCEELIRNISVLENVRVKGLMTIGPLLDDIQSTRPYFQDMYKLFLELKSLSIENTEFKYLSMGMSNDYTIALQEGANIIRIGSEIFGKRQ